VFVDQGEGKRKMLLTVGEEIAFIVGDMLSQLFFLEFPNVKLLATVAISFNTLG
jgi:hypothetical protein